MKILVVDNHSKHIKQILKEFKKVSLIDFKSLKDVNYNNYDGIILSGGYPLPVKYNEKEYCDELNLIKKFKKPILGICLGFELINFAFGEKLIRLQKKEKGVRSIKLVSSDRLFKFFPDIFKVYEGHRWVVTKNRFLKVLAISKYGIEAVKHPRKVIYGVQFHPEVFLKNTHSNKIFKNFIDIVKLERKKSKK